MTIPQVVNPKLHEIANRVGNYGGNKGGRWGYGGGYKGRENSGPKTHTRFSNGGGFKTNGYSNKGKSMAHL